MRHLLGTILTLLVFFMLLSELNVLEKSQGLDCESSFLFQKAYCKPIETLAP